MADKQRPGFRNPPTSARGPASRRQRYLPLVAIAVFAILAIMLLSHVEPAMIHHLSKLTPEGNRPQRGLRQSQRPVKAADNAKVKLEAHIMSKCPDARDCLRELIVPTMEKVSDIVDFNLSFIGTVDPEDNTVQCKHGPTECLGNTLLLCARSLYPNEAIISLGFANCLVSSLERIPERSLVESCALEHGVDFQKLNKCVSEDSEGEEMLRQSVQWSKDEGVVYSCTVRVGGKNWCVRDGGKWKDCEGGSDVKDLVGKIKELAGQKK